MATRNTYYWALFLSLLVSLLLGCQNLTKPTNEPVTDAKVMDERGGVKETGGDFLKVKAPKLGLILGGGGALSYAHIGLLHELEKQKVPVTAIAGVEWGALVAGAEAMSQKSHAVEWKLLKLPIEKFNSSSFFSKEKGGVKISQFDDFLNKTFGNNRMGQLAIPFACPFTHITREATDIQTKGLLKNVIKACWPMPPHFKVETVSAHLSMVQRLAEQLKKEGAELIVYADVTLNNELLAGKVRGAQPMIAGLWTQHRDYVKMLENSVVDEIITIPLSGYRMNSYKSLRSIVRAGQLKSQDSVKRFARKYGF